jgi:hypothetical protein
LPEYVTLTLDLYDGQGNYPASGSASFTPSAVLTGPGTGIIGQIPVTATFRPGVVPVEVSLLATDNEGFTPSPWTWSVTFAGVAGAPAPGSFPLPYDGGEPRLLSSVYP